ncbi:oligosaccharide flippase family protein [Vibrio alginolyticus]
MDIKKRLFSAYFWNIGGSWCVRLIGIASTLILVRFIEPESFGLVALATLCIGFFETLNSAGIGRYLMTQTDLNQKSLDSAWTLNIIIRLIVSIIIIISAPYMSSYFNEPRLEDIIYFVAINGFFTAFYNMGLLRLRKNLKFKKLVLLHMVSKVFSTLVTLSILFVSPDHWALLIGSGSYIWMYLIGSYYIYSFRPNLRFVFEKEMYSFSVFILLRNILSYLRNRGDVFVVSKFFDMSSIGRYKIGLEFAVLPFTEVISPAGLAIFSGLANYKHNTEELFDKTYKYLALVYLFVIPSIVGIWFVAPQFCTVILGEKWADTAPIMSSLAILMLSYPIRAMTNNLYDYLGKPKLGIFNDFIGLALLILISTTIVYDDVTQFSEMRGHIGIVFFLFIVAFARLTISFSIARMLEVVLIPVVSSSFMYWVFSYVYFVDEITLLGLVSNVLVGAISYSAFFIVLVFIIKPYSKLWKFWFDKAAIVSLTMKNKVVGNNP